MIHFNVIAFDLRHESLSKNTKPETEVRSYSMKYLEIDPPTPRREPDITESHSPSQGQLQGMEKLKEAGERRGRGKRGGVRGSSLPRTLGKNDKSASASSNDAKMIPIMILAHRGISSL